MADEARESSRAAPLLPGAVAPGLRLKDRYRVEKELGRGGIGVVYLARDEQLLDRQVVIKVLLERSAESEWFQKKFKQELQALVRIDHPGVVGALDAGEMPDGKPFFVMQFVQGVNLRSVMKQGRLDVADIASVVRQVGAALSAAHEKGVHHRDLKPENIMLQDLGHGERLAKIIDFGIATVQDPGEEGTQYTQIAGSVLYMAPEQLLGKPQAASDIYALGVIAYEMLTGQPPFRPASPYELPALQQQGVKVKPSQRRSDLPPEVDAVVLKALALDPRERPPSARSFADDLAYALTGGSGPVPSPLEPTVVTPTQTPSASAAAPTYRPAPTLTPSGAPTVIAATPSKLRAAAPEARRPPHPGPRPPVGEERKSRLAALALVGLGVLVVGGAAAGLLLWKKPIPERPSTPEPRTSTTVTPARDLAYFLTVQKYRDGRPYREPFQLAREMLFGPDDRLRLTVTSPQSGYLYIVNEGPEPRRGKPSYNVLFPTTTTGGGSASLAPGQEVQIPEKGWIKFDEQRGTESLWLVSSAREVSELEAVKGLANPKDRGVVSDPAQIDAISGFLTSHAATVPKRSEDAALKRTLLKAPGDVLVSVLKLEHQ